MWPATDYLLTAVPRRVNETSIQLHLCKRSHRTPQETPKNAVLAPEKRVVTGGFSTRAPATANALRLVREFPILQAESYCTAINAQAD